MSIVYKHISGLLVELIKKRDSNKNTFRIVDEQCNPILKKSEYSNQMQEQHRIISGFNNLELYKDNRQKSIFD